MFHQDCIFCKIIHKHIPAQIIEEDADSIVIQDIAPQAPIHYLIITKKHTINLHHLEQKEILPVAHSIFSIAQKLSFIDEQHKNFKLTCNNGSKAGQQIFHLHFHFLAGF